MARESYALTLWTYLQSEEAERLDRLVSEKDRIELADMIAVGFHDPKQLSRFDNAWRAKITGTREYREDALARAAELLKRRDEQMEH